MSAVPRPVPADLPVRPGEEPWTDAELKQVRAELESELAGLRADIARVASDIASRNARPHMDGPQQSRHWQWTVECCRYCELHNPESNDEH